MNRFIYYGNATSMPNYNCSFYTPSLSNPNKNSIAGVIDIAYGIVVILLYIPSLVVFYRQSRIACFKIMFLLGVTDIGAISVNSICTGFLLLRGATFCDFPNLIYISGSIGLGFWCSACLTCLILALNRILDMVSPLLVKVYFRGYSIYFVLIVPIVYGAVFVFFTPPILFSAKHQTWLFDPLVTNNRTFEYSNIPHTINNFSIVLLTCFLYVFFCLKVRKQFRKSFRMKRTARQRQIFIQSTLLCVIHLSASIVYVVMQFIDVPRWLTISSQYLWQLAHGCSVLIYLVFNRKVRSALTGFLTNNISAERSSNLYQAANQIKRSDELSPMHPAISYSSK